MNQRVVIAAVCLSFCSFSACQTATFATPADAEYSAQLKKAAAALEEHQYDNAIAACKKMLAVGSTAPLKSQALLIMEEAASSEHKYDISIDAMNQCIGLNKATAPRGSLYIDMMFWRRGKAHAANGDYALALADFQYIQPTRTSPREVVNLMRDQAACHEKLKQYDKSLADLSRALTYSERILGDRNNEITITRVKGEKISLMYERAKVYAAMGKLEESKRDKALADKLTDAW